MLSTTLLDTSGFAASFVMEHSQRKRCAPSWLKEPNEEDGIAEDVPSDKEEVKQSPEKRSKLVKTTANDKDEEAKAAKRLDNKEKTMEEKVRQEDNLSQSKEWLEMFGELAMLQDMLYDFMMQVNSHLDSVRWDASGKKVDVNQQILERIVRKNEKQKDHSLPVQVFLGKSDNTENNRPGSPCLLKKSCQDPTICSTPKGNWKTNEPPASSCSKLVDTGNCSFDSDDVNVTESSSSNAEHIAEILPEDISNGSSPEEVYDLGLESFNPNDEEQFLASPEEGLETFNPTDEEQFLASPEEGLESFNPTDEEQFLASPEGGLESFNPTDEEQFLASPEEGLESFNPTDEEQFLASPEEGLESFNPTDEEQFLASPEEGLESFNPTDEEQITSSKPRRR